MKQQIKQLLLTQKATLEKALEGAREAQLSAPSAMESHSDTTRSEKEKLVTALEVDIKRVRTLMQKIDGKESGDKLWGVKTIEVGGKLLQCCLVPSGMGGMKVGDFQLVSVDSPMGKRLLDEI